MTVDTPLLPDQWPAAPAKMLFDRVRRDPRPKDGTVTAFRDGQVTLRSNRRTEGFTNAIQEHGYQGVRTGDLVIHSMDGFAGAIGVSDSDGKASPVVHCYRPNDVDARFYAYLLRRLAEQRFITSLAKGIRERSTAFDAESFGSLRLPVPPLAEQRAIADYLDDETARIDALITKKRRMIELLGERERVEIDLIFDCLSQEFGTGPVAGLCSLVVDCVNKTAPTVDDQTGYGMLRTSNVRDGRVDVEGLFQVSPTTFRKWTSRGRPQRGDVLLTREAPVGEVGVLDTDDPLFLGQRLMMYRAAPDLASPDFLAHGLRSTSVQQQMALLGSGSLHEHLRVGDCSKFRVPLAPRAAQDDAMKQVRKIENRDRAAGQALEGQLVLLAERRQALITAAVTGKLEIPGVAA
ncbi:restriction endonuclease subunit S [Candidatus Neomicrothrix sp.]|uniref:restriction endonuclease subunit S n=1 Tax=Candidatus Neomicrothrix sp. TaxID=2719034 RepID=UPI002592A5A2|nr:restriction endonuclease subunit S [Candidatus Microthrix sp.]HMS49170.1 restriction endonuclease subunit S [Candidatus Microthrix sp.]